MKTISDIRLYRSDEENIDGNSLPHGFARKSLNLTVTRIVIKLREAEFSLGDFDHLYLNFTVCLPEGEIRPAKRSRDPYHPWYRYYDIGVSYEQYELLEAEAGSRLAVERIERTLIQFFAPDDKTRELICSAVSDAVTESSEMLAKYKEKKSTKAKAVIYLRMLDNGHFRPLLCVTDDEGREILREDLPEMLDTLSLGEIQLSAKKVTIQPKKNAIAAAIGLEPVSFELKR